MTEAQQDWARCKEWIMAAADTAPWPEPISLIEKKIEDGEYHFWAGPNCAVIAQIMHFDDRKAMAVVYAGGNMAELLNQMEPHLCAMAKEFGCSLTAIHGREGWIRACKPHGYKLAWSTLYKELA